MEKRIFKNGLSLARMIIRQNYPSFYTVRDFGKGKAAFDILGCGNVKKQTVCYLDRVIFEVINDNIYMRDNGKTVRIR